jgi:hypothetical protein
MRETRQSGSEGGGVGTTGAPYPYHDFATCNKLRHGWPALAGHDAEVVVYRQQIRLFPDGP